MVTKDELYSDARRLLMDGIPLKRFDDGTRYFLYPMNKEDYNIVIKAITDLRDSMSKMSYQNSQIKLNQFIHTWGFNPFKEGAFMGETKIKSDDDFKIIESLFEVIQGKLHTTQVRTGSYQCFCHKNFQTIAYAPHKTIRDSWNCMLIAYNNPSHAIVLIHKVDDNGKRIWG